LLGRTLLSEGNHSEAEKEYETGRAAKPDSVANWIGLAPVAVAAGNLPRALERYVDAVQHFPGYSPALLGKSYCLIALGRFAEAEGALDQAQASGAEVATVRRQRVWLYELRDAKRHPSDNPGTGGGAPL